MNFPSLPDQLHKFFIISGALILGFVFYYSDKTIDSISHRTDEAHKLVSESVIQSNIVNNMERNLMVLSSDLSQKYKVKNPLHISKDAIRFAHVFGGSINETIVRDSLNTELLKIEAENLKLENLNDQLDLVNKNIAHDWEIYYEKRLLLFGAAACAIILFIGGILRWGRIQSYQDALLKSQIPNFRQFNYCESCARTFSFRIKRGVELNGSESDLFCIECYNKGQFTDFLTKENVKEYQKKSVENLSRIDRWYVKRRFKKLIRWDEHDFRMPSE